MIRSTFGMVLNWIYFERDPEVGRIADQNWIGSAISRVNAWLPCKCTLPIVDRIQFRSDPLLSCKRNLRALDLGSLGKLILQDFLDICCKGF